MSKATIVSRRGSASVTVSGGPTVGIYRSQADGAWCVQIDTDGLPENAAGPLCRVYLNDGDLHDNPPYPVDGPKLVREKLRKTRKKLRKATA